MTLAARDDASPPRAPAEPVSRRHFVLRRLHSLSGVVPLGIFLVEHLWTNAHVLYGRASFDGAVGRIQRLPALLALEIAGIFVPLAFHAIYGMFIASEGRANVMRYPFLRNWLYLLQRVSGIVAFAFIAVHLWMYRVQKALAHITWPHFYHRLGVDLDRAGLFALYVTGVTATVYHFANGLSLAANTWGLATTERAQRRVGWACVLFGGALWLLGIDILLHFAFRCGGVIPLPGQGASGGCLR